MSNKAISELQEYTGALTGKEILIISNEDEEGMLVSQKYNLKTFRNEVGNTVYSEVSGEICALTSHISSTLSDALSVLENATSALSSLSSDVSSFYDKVSAHISTEISTFEYNVSNDVSTYVEEVTIPLKTIVAMSSLDYYTLIGDKLCCEKFLEEAAAKGPEALSAAQKVLWFDTSEDDGFHQLDQIRRMDSLQVQIYRLGVQMKDLHKVLENGVIPGDAYNDAKDEMIEFSDMLQPPDEIITTSEKLIEMSIYGNYYCKNKQLYYLMFNPSGWLPDKTQFIWIINEHDDSSSKVKTLSCKVNENVYQLRVALNEKVISSMASFVLEGAIYKEGESYSYSDDQEIIDSVIDALSATEQNAMSFYVSSDYVDPEFSNDPVITEDFDIEFTKGAADIQEPTITIKGNDYIDKSAMYYAIVNDTTKKFPLNVNTNWYFLSSYTDDEGVAHEVKTNSITKTFYLDDAMSQTGWVKYELLHWVQTPFCQISVTYDEKCTLKQVSEISADVHVESNYDKLISATKVIKGVGGIKPNTSLVEPTVKAVCAKFDDKVSLLEKQTTLYQGELVFFKDTNQLAVWNGEKFMTLNSSESSGLSKEEIQNIGFDCLNFTANSSKPYVSRVSTTSDGNLKVVQQSRNDVDSDYGIENDKKWPGIYVSHLLQIGKVFCGGKACSEYDVFNNKLGDLPLASHNFVELVNASDNDIYLDKVYLIYHTTDTEFQPSKTQSGNSEFEFIKLEGKIKAHGTYLIRGARCNPTKSAMIKVPKCDLEWKKRQASDKDILVGNYREFTRTGNLIEFSEKSASFFLYYATANSVDSSKHGDNIRDLVINKNTDIAGYIDLFGLQGSIAPSFYNTEPGYESPTSTLHNMLIYKWFYMDPASQGNKDKGKRSEKTVITSVNLEKQPIEFFGDTRKRDKFYYSDDQKLKFAPTSSTDEDAGIFSGKSHFTADEPNMINVTFGIQATRSPSKLASRCFNWVSVGYHDEFICYRKQGTSKWNKAYSITAESVNRQINDRVANKATVFGSDAISYGFKFTLSDILEGPLAKKSTLSSIVICAKRNWLGVSSTDPALGVVTIDGSEVADPSLLDQCSFGSSRWTFNGSEWLQSSNELVLVVNGTMSLNKIAQSDASEQDMKFEFAEDVIEVVPDGIVECKLMSADGTSCAIGIKISDEIASANVCNYSAFNGTTYTSDPNKSAVFAIKILTDIYQEYHDQYDRFRWAASDGTFATTHKVILHEVLEDGTYEYYIGREGNDKYASPVNTFHVDKDEDVNVKFSFIQVSDQQGFNWLEYQAWKAACKEISKSEKDFNFTINTGDIAQSGNRVSEWLDYHNGRKFLSTKEEMFTIGNNDLCGFPQHILGDGGDDTSKYNLINVLNYYVFELDPYNICKGTFPKNGDTHKEYPLYSLYSFNYGQWHFISLVSEIREYYAAAFGISNSEFSDDLNADVERWFRKDLVDYMRMNGVSDCSRCIVYMHEMPFTIVTPGFFDKEGLVGGYEQCGRSIRNKVNNAAATGCKLNIENRNGDYRFSRIFKKAGIRLVIGGHKHTFSLSNPLYDAPDGVVVPDGQLTEFDSDTVTPDQFMTKEVDYILSRKPVIELPLNGTFEFVASKKASVLEAIDDSAKRTEVESLFDELESQYESHDETGFEAALNALVVKVAENGIATFENINQSSKKLKDFIRFRFVNKITAPTFVMSQATGYKIISNKELPSAIAGNTVSRYTPWLLSYCASRGDSNTATAWSGKVNGTQCRPTYIRYDFDANNIRAQIMQVDGIYNVKYEGGGKKDTYPAYTLDNQNTQLSCIPITFGSFGKHNMVSPKVEVYTPTMLDEYMQIYKDYISDDTYIIKL